jgi:hypothetical protein
LNNETGNWKKECSISTTSDLHFQPLTRFIENGTPSHPAQVRFA